MTTYSQRENRLPKRTHLLLSCNSTCFLPIKIDDLTCKYMVLNDFLCRLALKNERLYMASYSFATFYTSFRHISPTSSCSSFVFTPHCLALHGGKLRQFKLLCQTWRATILQALEKKNVILMMLVGKKSICMPQPGYSTIFKKTQAIGIM